VQIEQRAPGLERVISPHQEIEELGRGYRYAEGPVWHREDSCLLFSDVFNSRRMKWSATEKVSVVEENTNNANGLTRDHQGRLVICEPGLRRVSRREQDGSVTVIANSYRNQPLNQPNDVVVKSDGSIYFTDPIHGGVESELDFYGVYRVSPDLGSINCLVRDFAFPNGLAFSPDETVLYINDYNRNHIRAFDVRATGLLALETDRVFSSVSNGPRTPAADGMKVDMEGTVYCTGHGGIWIFSPDGVHLGTIPTGDGTTNLAWGDDDWSAMYITTIKTLLRIRLKIPGVPVPRGTLEA